MWLSAESPHGSTLLPELASLGRASRAALDLERSRRDKTGQMFEIVYILRGSEEWQGRNQTCRLAAADLFIAGPDWWPTSPGRAATPGELCWMTLRLDRTTGLRGLPRAASNAIADALAQAAGRVMRGTPVMPLLFDRLIEEHRRSDGFASWAARASLHSLIAELLRATGPDRAVERPPPSERIATALALVEDRLAEPLSVAELATAADMGLVQFHQLFRAETGHTPADYRARRRLLKAQELLDQPFLSVTDIALTLGFSTSQYFATFFRRFTGLCPRDYRRRRHPS